MTVKRIKLTPKQRKYLKMFKDHKLDELILVDKSLVQSTLSFGYYVESEKEMLNNLKRYL